MRVEVRLPQWGMGMQQGRLLTWLRRVGDRVDEDEPLAEVETAKAQEQLIAPASGVVSQILVEADAVVPVGTVLAVIDEDES